jgi:hypothetical protein
MIGEKVSDFIKEGSKLSGRITVLPGRGFLVDAVEEYERRRAPQPDKLPDHSLTREK